MTIETGHFVSLTYQLRLDNENGAVVETVTDERPLEFLYGMGMMLPRFEEKIGATPVGGDFSFALDPAEAYGEHSAEAIVEVPKNIFEIDGKISDKLLAVGNAIPMMDSSGNRMQGIVKEIGESVVVMDFNHPMAGKRLHFTGKLLAARVPSEQELAKFNHHCGCGDSCCGSDSGCGSDNGSSACGGCSGGCH